MELKKMPMTVGLSLYDVLERRPDHSGETGAVCIY